MSKWNNHTYNWTRPEERDKAIFKLWVVWLPSAATKRKVRNINGVKEYYGKYLEQDQGEKQLTDLVLDCPLDYQVAYLYKNKILYRAWKHGGIEMRTDKKPSRPRTEPHNPFRK